MLAGVQHVERPYLHVVALRTISGREGGGGGKEEGERNGLRGNGREKEKKKSRRSFLSSLTSSSPPPLLRPLTRSYLPLGWECPESRDGWRAAHGGYGGTWRQQENEGVDSKVGNVKTPQELEEVLGKALGYGFQMQRGCSMGKWVQIL